MQQKYFTKNKRPLKGQKNITLINAINQTDWDKFIETTSRLEKLMGELVVCLRSPTPIKTIAPELVRNAQNEHK